MKTQNDPAAFHSLHISRSGLRAQRRRMDAISENLANAHTTRGADGGPYRPKVVVLAEGDQSITYARKEAGGLETTAEGHLSGGQVSEQTRSLRGVKEEVLIQDRRPRLEFDPDHPDADADGYVAYPDINVVEEMTQLMLASRAWEANATALQAAKTIAAKSLEI